jgi:hypothetical protein
MNPSGSKELKYIVTSTIYRLNSRIATISIVSVPPLLLLAQHLSSFAKEINSGRIP